MSEQYDAVVVGGGHNGLVCAAYLAKSGLRVRLIEKNPILGGAAITQEFHPGFRNSVYSYAVSLLNPTVISELALINHGLRILPLGINGWKRFIPLTEATNFAVPVNPDQAVALFDQHFPGDGAAFMELQRRIRVAADALRSVVLDTPPNLRGDFRSLMRTVVIGNRLRKLTTQGRIELIKLMTMSVADYLAEHLGGEVIKGYLGYSATVGNLQSIYSAGSAYVLLHHVFGEVNGLKGQWGQAVGGMGAITQAIAASARSHGAELSSGMGVREVIVERSRAKGVVLDDGSVVRSSIVVSSLNPRLLFSAMIDQSVLPTEFARRMRHWRCDSGVFRMNVALTELPQFSSVPQEDIYTYRTASVITTPSLGYLEEAFKDAKCGGIARKPIVEMQIPTIQDSSLAPAGGHVASLFCQFFAYEQADGRSWDDIECEVADGIIDYMTNFAPNFRKVILGRQLKSPITIERDLGMVRGDIFHGQLHLDQIFSMRPAPNYADYRAPVSGLYMCGSGTHPGGGVTGAPGRNAAQEIIRDLRSWWQLTIASSSQHGQFARRALEQS